MAGVDEQNQEKRDKRLGVKPAHESLEYREHIPKIAADDAKVVVEKDIQYGASWCRRGGAGAYMVMVRKSDRIEQRVAQYGYDIFKAVESDKRAEGLIDDIRDLRGYLLLIEGYLIENRVVEPRYHGDGRCTSTFLGKRCELVVEHPSRLHTARMLVQAGDEMEMIDRNWSDAEASPGSIET